MYDVDNIIKVKNKWIQIKREYCFQSLMLIFTSQKLLKHLSFYTDLKVSLHSPMLEYIPCTFYDKVQAVLSVSSIHRLNNNQARQMEHFRKSVWCFLHIHLGKSPQKMFWKTSIQKNSEGNLTSPPSTILKREHFWFFYSELSQVVTAKGFQ